MKPNFHENRQRHRKLNTFVIATIFIVVGLMMLARNLGWIDPMIYHIIVSWQMLLIVLGIVQLIKRHYVGAFSLLAVGTFFLLSRVNNLGIEWIKDYWPLFLVMGGIGLLFKLKEKDNQWPWGRGGNHLFGESQSDDGFIYSDVSFGSSKHIVLDPVFRGADIDISFGSVVLDLRRTTLETPQTVVRIDCSFGGMELFVPSTWNVQIEADNTMSSCSDKRMMSHEIDEEHVLIIRGDITFGGLEIKN